MLNVMTLFFVFISTESFAQTLNVEPTNIEVSYKKNSGLRGTTQMTIKSDGYTVLSREDNGNPESEFGPIINQVILSAKQQGKKVTVDLNKLNQFSSGMPLDMAKKLKESLTVSTQSSRSSCEKTMNDISEIFRSGESEDSKRKKINEKLSSYFSTGFSKTPAGAK